MQVQLKLGGAAAQIDDNENRVTIGRDGSLSDLVSEDASISRRHCEVFLQRGATYIRDLGSSNGTWVDGNPIGASAVPLKPGSQIFVGHVPLLVEWAGSADGATMVGALPDVIRSAMEQRKSSIDAGTYQPAPAAPQKLATGGSDAPLPADFAYRRQGSNSNGVLLIALAQDTYSNNTVIDGYLEFEALDNETVASITVDLLEYHKKGSSKGHIWDRVIVRQGPWKAQKGDVLPMPFKLRVPPGTSVSGKDVHWTIRGYVDISWARDIETDIDITMRNTDIEKLRDALGALDYRIVDLYPEPLGQQFDGTFQPPAQLRKEIGINTIDLHIEYLGSNIKIEMALQKSNFFKSTRKADFVFELERLRAASMNELAQHLLGVINQLMQK